MKIVYGILWLIMKTFWLVVLICVGLLYIPCAFFDALDKELKEEQMMTDFNEWRK